MANTPNLDARLKRQQEINSAAASKTASQNRADTKTAQANLKREAGERGTQYTQSAASGNQIDQLATTFNLGNAINQN